MVTARRSTEIISSAYEPVAGGISVLERPRNFEESVDIAEQSSRVDFTQEEARRRDNLNRLMNYDRFAEQTAENVETVQNVAQTSSALTDEDIRPTSTTMQFGEDIDNISREMNRAIDADAQEGYRLNKKGKVVVMLYALVVTVILALIVLNTGVLATLSNTTEAKAQQLSATVAKYNELQTEYLLQHYLLHQR